MNLEAQKLISEYNALQERFEKAELFFQQNTNLDIEIKEKYEKAYKQIIEKQQAIYEKLRELFPAFDWKLFNTNQKINLNQLNKLWLS